MKKKIIRLGTSVADSVTKMAGMLTIYNLDMDNNELYLFQPASLNPETQQPADRFWITKSRIVHGLSDHAELPLSVLGTPVRDKATGFKGIAISINYYINGCVHIDVKPSGFIEKTGASIGPVEIDIRRLEGPEIDELSDENLKESNKKFPSPTSNVPKSNR